jgi:hypothetical protein
MLSAFPWKSLLSFAQSKGRSKPTRISKPAVEFLEDRLTPSAATVDLTTRGAIGSINGAIFRQVDPQPTGTGVIDSFVRLQSTKSAVQQGYNSDHRPVQFNENTSPQFTRSLAVSDVPVVVIGGAKYREFLLDINQKASQPLLSLDELRIYVGDAPNLTGYNCATHQLAGLDATYDMDKDDMDAYVDNWIKLNARLNQGSGKGDMLAYIPDSAFSGGSYIYLYSKFGVNLTANSGFEEWAKGSAALTSAAGSISGSVFNATTHAGVEDVLVFLDANHNGTLDSNEVFDYTDASGAYQFSFLATGLGTYSVYDVTVLPPDDSSSPVQMTQVSLQTDGQHVVVNFDLTYETPPDDGGDDDSDDDGDDLPPGDDEPNT